MPEPETLEPKKYLYDKMFYKTKYFVIWRNNFDFEKGRKNTNTFYFHLRPCLPLQNTNKLRRFSQEQDKIYYSWRWSG